MKRIDERVLDIEKSDFNTKFKHEQALRANVVERILNTSDEKFDLIASNSVSLKINNDTEIILREVNADAEISIHQGVDTITSFLYKEPYIPSCWREKKEKEKEEESDCELLRNKIESIRETKLKVTVESKKYMSLHTKRFYAAFDAISGDFE